jgi:hypothetical protein
MRLLTVAVAAGVLGLSVPHDAAAAPMAVAPPQLAPASDGGSIENVYYYRGGYYPYRYGGAYYRHRYYRYGRYHYY